MTTDPRIRALASEAAALIKTLTNANNAQIEAIYRDFRTQAEAIQAEASTKTLAGSGADLLQADSINR